MVANIVVESATKWIGGHGTSIGGSDYRCRHFNWNNATSPYSPSLRKDIMGIVFGDIFNEKSAAAIFPSL